MAEGGTRFPIAPNEMLTLRVVGNPGAIRLTHEPEGTVITVEGHAGATELVVKSHLTGPAAEAEEPAAEEGDGTRRSRRRARRG